MQGLEGGDEVFRLHGSAQYGVMHNGGRSLRWSACARGALDRSMMKGMDDVSLAQEQGQMNAEYSYAYICARCDYGGLIKTFSNLTTLAWMDIGVRMLVCLFVVVGWMHVVHAWHICI